MRIQSEVAVSFSSTFKKSSRTKHPALVVAAALLFGTWANAAGAAPSSRADNAPIVTQVLSSSSLCGNRMNFFQQSLNGDFKGCFRVPDLHSSSLLVALQTFLMQSGAPTGPTTTTLHTAPVGAIRLSLATSVVTPGEHVVVTGHFLGRPPSIRDRQSVATLCWDGCETGLQEESLPLTWASPSTFRASLSVPETAWLTMRSGVVAAQPLLSGDHQVGLQCVVATSGCALGGAEAQTTIHLQAPPLTRCYHGATCEFMTLSPSSAPVGAMVYIKGWAPLESTVGPPGSFSLYNLSVTTATSTANYPDLSYAQLKAGTYDVVLTPRVLRVEPGTSWASVGRLGYLSSTFAGPSSISPSPTSNLIAWCPSSGIDLSGGPTLVRVSTTGVAAALRGSNLSLPPPVPSSPPCATVLLDPLHHASVYASFSTEVEQGAPPLYFAGLYTTNDGATWHRVPSPAGMKPDDFGGFVVRANDVEAMFVSPNNGGSQTPWGTVNGRVVTEVSANGGQTWSSATLGCPSVGPCTIFGPYEWGHCAMNAAPQSVLHGTASANSKPTATWSTTLWTQTVNSCFSPQLAVTSSRNLMLVDPSSQYPLLRSTDAGQTWAPISIPLVTTAGYSTSPGAWGNSMLLAPDGSLFSVITSSSGQRDGLFRLEPGATTWCQVPKVFSVPASNSFPGPLHIRGANLVWVETISSNSLHASTVLEVAPLSTLNC
ncbi:MAG: hypothetical protein PXZ08_02095 [Actinomycetota bacterium]|nr:hypothetical protein [Actinomycetota bacterium]